MRNALHTLCYLSILFQLMTLFKGVWVTLRLHDLILLPFHSLLPVWGWGCDRPAACSYCHTYHLGLYLPTMPSETINKGQLSSVTHFAMVFCHICREITSTQCLHHMTKGSKHIEHCSSVLLWQLSKHIQNLEVFYEYKVCKIYKVSKNMVWAQVHFSARLDITTSICIWVFLFCS